MCERRRRGWIWVAGIAPAVAADEQILRDALTKAATSAGQGAVS